VCGDRRGVREARALSVMIQALEFEPVGLQNQWVDAMFLTPNYNSSHLPPTQEIRERVGVGEVERNRYGRNLLLKGKPVTTGTEEILHRVHSLSCLQQVSRTP
jgi:hypothetical protein